MEDSFVIMSLRRLDFEKMNLAKGENFLESVLRTPHPHPRRCFYLSIVCGNIMAVSFTDFISLLNPPGWIVNIGLP